jgi:oligopeptide/dipeptide ABC transporter ATP-binding protein
MALFGPALAPQNPLSSSSLDFAHRMQGPSSAHWLGTDEWGRDLLSQFLLGARVTLIVGVVAGLAAAGVGAVVGICAGYFGGWTDRGLTFLDDWFLVIPFVPFAVLMAALLQDDARQFPGGQTGIIVLVLVITGWAGTTRVVRARVLAVRERQFVERARSQGASHAWILRRYILPSVMPVVGPTLLIIALAVLGGLVLPPGLGDLTRSRGARCSTTASRPARSIRSVVVRRAAGRRHHPVRAGLLRSRPGDHAPPTPGATSMSAPVLRVDDLHVGRPGEGEVRSSRASPSCTRRSLGLAAITGSPPRRLFPHLLSSRPAHAWGRSIWTNRRRRGAHPPANRARNARRALDGDRARVRARSTGYPVRRIAPDRHAIRLHRPEADRPAVHERVRELLERVGLGPDRADQYPHEFSGGMRQRVMIALALACDPEVIVADEPTTALDVMTQAQVLALLDELRRDLGLALLLITHDLAVIAETCERVAVMYAGRIVETGPTSTVFAVPQHPYTQRLLGAFPLVGGERALAPAIPGTAPDPSDPPSGCRFHPAAISRARPASTARRRSGSSATTTSRPARSRRCSDGGRRRPAPSTRPRRRHAARRGAVSRSPSAGAVVSSARPTAST